LGKLTLPCPLVEIMTSYIGNRTQSIDVYLKSNPAKKMEMKGKGECALVVGGMVPWLLWG